MNTLWRTCAGGWISRAGNGLGWHKWQPCWFSGRSHSIQGELITSRAHGQQSGGSSGAEADGSNWSRCSCFGPMLGPPKTKQLEWWYSLTSRFSEKWKDEGQSLAMKIRTCDSSLQEFCRGPSKCPAKVQNIFTARIFTNNALEEICTSMPYSVFLVINTVWFLKR